MLTIIAGIKAAAERNALAPAIIGAQRAFTYGEILDVISWSSAYLADHGLSPATRVAANIADPIYRLLLTLACLHCGAVPVVVPNIRDLRRGAHFDLVVGANNLLDPTLPADLVVGQKTIGGSSVAVALRSFDERRDDQTLFLVASSDKRGKITLAAESYGDFRRMIAEAATGGRAVGAEEVAELGVGDRHIFTFGEQSREGFVLTLATLAAGATLIRPRSELLDLVKAIVTWQVTAITSTGATLFALAGLMEKMSLSSPSVKRVGVLGPAPPKSLADRLARLFNSDLSLRTEAASMAR